jgi:hypothetical protein
MGTERASQGLNYLNDVDFVLGVKISSSRTEPVGEQHQQQQRPQARKEK